MYLLALTSSDGVGNSMSRAYGDVLNSSDAVAYSFYFYYYYIAPCRMGFMVNNAANTPRNVARLSSCLLFEGGKLANIKD